MKKQLLTPWVTLSMGAFLGLAGCSELQSDEVVEDDAATAQINGLSLLNGLNLYNGLSLSNGLTMHNGLSLYNGLSMTNGLSSTSGLMTSPMGRRAVNYLAKCALGSDQTLNKKDQSGRDRSYKGGIGLARNWYNGGTTVTEQKNVSACLMAHLNTAGVNVPIWLSSETPGIGWGRNSAFPIMEGTFFGNLMGPGGDGKVPAYFCEGSGFGNGIVPGRLGAKQANSAYRNPFGDGAKCDDHCVKHSSGDGYTSCYGYTNPVTVWRASSYNPVFDPNYRYTLTSSSSGLTLDVLGGSTANGAQIVQWYANNSNNQRWQIVLVATSQWKIVNINSGKVISNRSGTAVTQETYNSTLMNDRWVLDDHNGHFKLKNKATGLVLRSPSSGANAGMVTATYVGAADTDWDLAAVDSVD